MHTDVRSEEDLLPPGAERGTIATDLDQSTGLERFEILGKMQGVDVFDMKPLDASRKGMCYSLSCRPAIRNSYSLEGPTKVCKPRRRAVLLQRGKYPLPK